jgi:hypothetical protein
LLLALALVLAAGPLALALALAQPLLLTAASLAEALPLELCWALALLLAPLLQLLLLSREPEALLQPLELALTEGLRLPCAAPAAPAEALPAGALTVPAAPAAPAEQLGLQEVPALPEAAAREAEAEEEAEAAAAGEAEAAAESMRGLGLPLPLPGALLREALGLLDALPQPLLLRLRQELALLLALPEPASTEEAEALG